MSHGSTTLDLIERGALQDADRIAVVAGDHHLTFAEANTLANRLARALHAPGVAPRDRVALPINNSLHAVPLDFACVKAG